MTIQAVAPKTGEVVKEYREATGEEIKKAYESAKEAYPRWARSSFQERTDKLQSLRKVILEDRGRIVDVLTKDTGKVDMEALMTDVLATLEFTKHYETNTEKVLSKEKRKTPSFMRKNESYVEYEPMGVVSIISPWNFPLQLSMVPAVTALMAGNAVLLKPSEVTPMVGELIKKIFDRSDIDSDLIHVFQGGEKVGKKLVNIGPDKIFFTGSIPVGKKIMKNGAEHLTHVSLELGGKDPMIVLDDANLERAVKGAVFGSFSNVGQACMSIERVYVQENIYDEFIEDAVEGTKKLEVGPSSDADIGPMTKAEQVDIVEEQVEDAREKGAKVLVGGKRDGFYYYPTVLTDVDHDMKIMKEETFGPVMPVMPFKDMEEAIDLANDTKYGLNSSVWSDNVKKAQQVVSRLDTGNAYINGTLKNIGNPYLPFGGVKKSGMGRYHGPEGLKTFSQTKSVMINKNKKDEFNWFPYSRDLNQTVEKVIDTFYGDIGFFKKVKNMISIMRDM